MRKHRGAKGGGGARRPPPARAGSDKDESANPKAAAPRHNSRPATAAKVLPNARVSVAGKAGAGSGAQPKATIRLPATAPPPRPKARVRVAVPATASRSTKVDADDGFDWDADEIGGSSGEEEDDSTEDLASESGASDTGDHGAAAPAPVKRGLAGHARERKPAVKKRSQTQGTTRRAAELDSASDADISDASDGSDDSSDDGFSSKSSGKAARRARDPSSGERLTMAAVMADILGKTVKSESQVPILAKDKRAEKAIEAERAERKAKRAQRLERRELQEKGHRPHAEYDLNYEKQLKKMATRGVVKLFNAIAKQQKEVEQVAQAPPSAQQRVATMSKDSFLDFLRKSAKAPAGSTTPDASVKPSVPGWKVLSDDYLMGARMKDWEKPVSADMQEEREDGGREMELEIDEYEDDA